MHKRGPEVDFSLLQLSFLGLEQLVSNQAETLVLVGNRAYRNRLVRSGGKGACRLLTGAASPAIAAAPPCPGVVADTGVDEARPGHVQPGGCKHCGCRGCAAGDRAPLQHETPDCTGLTVPVFLSRSQFKSHYHLSHHKVVFCPTAAGSQ